MNKQQQTPTKNKLQRLLFFMLFFAASAANAQKVDELKSQQQTTAQLSSTFKTLKGKERIDVFNALKPIIKTLSQKMCNPNAATLQPTTANELIALLGKPDVSKNANEFAYNMSTHKQFGQISFKTNSAGQLLHYSITDIL